MPSGGQSDLILGIDECGLGSWAGPLAVGGVIIDPGTVDGVRDSKLVAEEKRYSLSDEIKAKAKFWYVAMRDNKVIDAMGVGPVWNACVMEVLQKARVQFPDIRAVVDGDKLPRKARNAVAVVDADATVYAVSAASLVAKATRDLLMIEMDKKYPGYELAKNKGYGTAEHRWLMKRSGLCPIHRVSYKVRSVR